MNSSSSSYCSGLEAVHARYVGVHGFVAVSVCAAGALSNVLALAVLRAAPWARQTQAPFSALLAALAATDALVMLEYVPFALHTYVLTGRPLEQRFSRPWAVYILFHANFAQVLHTMSIWLTVTLALWRYLAVHHAARSRRWCSLHRTRLAILASLVGALLLCTPLFLAFAVVERPDPVSGQPLYVVDVSELALARGGLLLTANYWVYSVVLKLLPCALLCALSHRLLAALLEVRRRRRVLLHKADKDGERTGRLLVAVLVLFLASELPQGILGLLSMVLGEPFFASCYTRLGELMDMLTLTSIALNFPLYCVMSRHFRASCAQLLLGLARCRHTQPPPQGHRPLPEHTSQQPRTSQGVEVSVAHKDKSAVVSQL